MTSGRWDEWEGERAVDHPFLSSLGYWQESGQNSGQHAVNIPVAATSTTYSFALGQTICVLGDNSTFITNLF